MSEADKLLEGLTEEQIAVYSADLSTEEHIIVNDDRTIVVPDDLKRIAVQFDHDVETVIFDCPRYWDEHDMSKMKIYINYMRADGALGMYWAKNVVVDDVDDSIMHFEWIISRNVTQVKGDINFLVCAKKTDKDGEEVNHWNSELCKDMYISEGLECTETILSEYPDIVTQLLTRMDTVEIIASPGAIEKYVNDCLKNDPLLQEKMEEIITPAVIDNYVITYLKNNQTFIQMISDGNGNVTMGLATVNEDSIKYTTTENSAGGMTLEIG